MGNHGSVVESNFYTKLRKLVVQEGKKDQNFVVLVTQVFRGFGLSPQLEERGKGMGLGV